MKKVLLYIIFLALAIIGVPIVINELYLQNKGYMTVWEGADVLSFYGAALGSVGTIVLGIIAWKQNERLLKLEETKYTLETQPFVMLVDWEMVRSKDPEPKSKKVLVAIGDPNNSDVLFSIGLSNTTNAFLTAEYIKVEAVDQSKKKSWEKGYIGSTSRKIILPANEKGQICFWGKYEDFKEMVDQGKLKFSFLLENRFGDRYIESFEASITLFSHEYAPGCMSYMAKIWANKYHVEKYEDTESMIFM